VQAAADGTFVVYSVSDFSHPAELFRLGLGPKAGAPQALTRLNADVLKDVTFGEASSIGTLPVLVWWPNDSTGQQFIYQNR